MDSEARKLALAELESFPGGDSIYTHGLIRSVRYTEGAQQAAEIGKAYWLLDLIASWQLKASVRREPFQVWTLTVGEDRKAIIRATDGNTRQIAVQRIPYSDFPLPEFKLWVEGGVILLPSEH